MWWLLFTPIAADAFDCVYNSTCGCDWADGDQLTYHINTNDFTSSQINEIEDAANAWDAGAGEILRGANWEFIRGSDTSSDGFNGNGSNNVRMKPDSWFENNGFGEGTPGATSHTTLPQCGRNDADITFNESVTYTNNLPSNDNGDTSIGQTALHEFGHVLGLDHEDSVVATMNTLYPGGDLGETKYRIHEDDYVGLAYAKGDSSTGRNLMLSRWRLDEYLGDIFSTEVWDLYGDIYQDWEAGAGCTISASVGPSPILAVIVGTSSQSPEILWYLSASSCSSGTAYVLGTRTPTLNVNVPYAVTPDGGYHVPSSTPPGDYHLCAKIDRFDSISETSEADNIVESDKMFTVASLYYCP